MLDLRGVNAKINRAQQCLKTLDGDIAAFCEYERRKHVFATERGLSPVLHSREPEPLIDYAVRAGEIAYNLRSALDHLVWQLVLDNGEDPTRNGFPIFFNEGQYRTGAKKLLKGVKQDRSEMIRLLQPFHKDSVIGRHLWMLNSICNIDKHRYLNVANVHSLVSVPMTKDGKAEAVVDVCFRDNELEEASVGYGSALEQEGINRPPVTSSLAGCLTAVKVAVEWLHDGYLPDN